MALTHTPPGEIGSLCPDFSVQDIHGKNFSKQDFSKFKAKLFMFICNHCPYVKALEDRISHLSCNLPEDTVMVGVCSNDPKSYPEDAKEELLKRYQEKNFAFTYLVDESQSMAKSFNAVCTPDFFIYDKNFKLTYRGRFDDSWKEPSKVTKEELKMALEQTAKISYVSFPQTPSMGCSIKWKE